MEASQMLDDRGGPNCEKATIVPGNGKFRVIGAWDRYWRHWIKDGLGRTHFIVCGGQRSNCKICAYVRANWDSNPAVREHKVGSSNLFNVIDRRDNWCVQNKHTKILCQWKSEIGVGPKIFDELKEVVNVNGSWDGKDGKGGDWDVIVTKSGSGMTGTTYKVQADREKITLSDEERKYGTYDLKTIIPPMSTPEEVEEALAAINGGGSAAETSPPESLGIDDLKKDAPVEAISEPTPAPTPTPKTSLKKAPSPKSAASAKKNHDKCQTNNCEGMLDYNDDEKEVTCPKCKSTYELSAGAEENPFS